VRGRYAGEDGDGGDLLARPGNDILHTPSHLVAMSFGKAGSPFQQCILDYFVALTKPLSENNGLYLTPSWRIR
jgi:hypothetical protein